MIKGDFFFCFFFSEGVRRIGERSRLEEGGGVCACVRWRRNKEKGDCCL